MSANAWCYNQYSLEDLLCDEGISAMNQSADISKIRAQDKGERTSDCNAFVINAFLCLGVMLPTRPRSVDPCCTVVFSSALLSGRPMLGESEKC